MCVCWEEQRKAERPFKEGETKIIYYGTAQPLTV